VSLNENSWNSHHWLQRSPRRVVVQQGKQIFQRRCVRCARDFIADESDNHFAVFVSAMSFYKLADEVTARWLVEKCAGQRLSSDDDDRKRKVAELPIGDAQGEIGSRGFGAAGQLGN
jgi:hypothetical protein